jgi:hypothetical protein
VRILSGYPIENIACGDEEFANHEGCGRFYLGKAKDNNPAIVSPGTRRYALHALPLV